MKMNKTLCSIALTALAFSSCHTPKIDTPKTKLEDNFEPNPDNNEYRKKFLGVKKRNYKK